MRSMSCEVACIFSRAAGHSVDSNTSCAQRERVGRAGGVRNKSGRMQGD